MQLVEAAFFTPDVEGMTVFYRALLGAAPVAESPDMAIFMAGGTKIFIHRTYEAGEGALPPENHLAFSVPDVDAACASLQAAGVAVQTPAQDYYWGRSAYLRAPDGQLIELIQEKRD
ncbi:MAG: VOC family protein [Anaerolineae bacterium]|nr:MAG: VOC family protein [Anaerolineae bacterium]